MQPEHQSTDATEVASGLNFGERQALLWFDPPHQPRRWHAGSRYDPRQANNGALHALCAKGLVVALSKQAPRKWGLTDLGAEVRAAVAGASDAG